ncbi:MAG: hypothetical protein METHP_00131 [Methanoregula sp. SKADARSKE-2]|nr:MAG: hypothetical protein METHP_00131 [Methanoregula sp. SKADARSKE-2]
MILRFFLEASTASGEESKSGWSMSFPGCRGFYRATRSLHAPKTARSRTSPPYGAIGSYKNDLAIADLAAKDRICANQSRDPDRSRPGHLRIVQPKGQFRGISRYPKSAFTSRQRLQIRR